MEVYVLIREENWLENNMACNDKAILCLFAEKKTAEIARKSMLKLDKDRMHHTSAVEYKVETHILIGG